MVAKILTAILLFQIVVLVVAPDSYYTTAFDGGLAYSINSAATFKISFDSRQTSLSAAIDSTISSYMAIAKSTFDIYPEAYNSITNHILVNYQNFQKKWPKFKNNTVLEQLFKEIDAGKAKIPTRKTNLDADLATLQKNFVTDNVILKSLQNESNDITKHLYDERQNYTCVLNYTDTMLLKMDSILGLMTSNFANQNFLERDGVNKYSNAAGSHVRTLASHAFFVPDVCLKYPTNLQDQCLGDNMATIASLTATLQDLDKLFDGYYSILKEEANLRARLLKFVKETDVNVICFKRETGGGSNNA